jgi:hypothetical protein
MIRDVKRWFCDMRSDCWWAVIIKCRVVMVKNENARSIAKKTWPKSGPFHERHYCRSSYLRSRTHSPLRFELACHIVFGKDGSLRNGAHTVCTITNSSQFNLRDPAPVTADAASITHSIRIFKLLWGSKVQPGEGPRFSEQMSNDC